LYHFVGQQYGLLESADQDASGLLKLFFIIYQLTNSVSSDYVPIVAI